MRRIARAVLAVCVLAMASTNAMPGQAGLPRRADVDLRTRHEQGAYYVSFCSQSVAKGYAFVTVWTDKPLAARPAYRAFGLHRKSAGHGSASGTWALGTVPAAIAEAVRGGALRAGTDELTCRVDQAAHGAADRICRSWADSIEEEAQSYERLSKDCVSFLAEIARAIGLDPPRRWRALTPQALSEALFEAAAPVGGARPEAETARELPACVHAYGTLLLNRCRLGLDALLVIARHFEGQRLEVRSARLLRQFQGTLERDDILISAAVAASDGRSVRVRRTAEGWEAQQVRQPDAKEAIRLLRWQMDLDRANVAAPGAAYDARLRPWYTGGSRVSMEKGPPTPRVYWTRPYRFMSTGRPGISVATSVTGAAGKHFVVAVDLDLGWLREEGERLLAEDDGLLYVATRADDLLAFFSRGRSKAVEEGTATAVIEPHMDLEALDRLQARARARQDGEATKDRTTSWSINRSPGGLDGPDIGFLYIHAHRPTEQEREQGQGEKDVDGFALAMPWASASEQTEENRDKVVQVAFSPSGTYLALGMERGSLVVIDMTERTLAFAAEAHARSVGFIDFSADGRHLLTGAQDRQVCLWDVERGKRVLCFEGAPMRLLYDIAISPDGGTALARGFDGFGVAWDLRSDEKRRDLGSYVFDFDPKSRFFVTASHRHPGASIVRLDGDDTTHTFAQGIAVGSLAVGPAGRVIAYAELPWAKPCHMALIDARTRREIRHLTLPSTGDKHDPGAMDLAFSGDGKRLLVGCTDGRVYEVDTTKTMEIQHTYRDPALTQARWVRFAGPHGDLVLASGRGEPDEGATVCWKREGDVFLWRRPGYATVDVQGCVGAEATKTGDLCLFDPGTGKNLRVLRAWAKGSKWARVSPPR